MLHVSRRQVLAAFPDGFAGCSEQVWRRCHPHVTPCSWLPSRDFMLPHTQEEPSDECSHLAARLCPWSQRSCSCSFLCIAPPATPMSASLWRPCLRPRLPLCASPHCLEALHRGRCLQVLAQYESLDLLKGFQVHQRSEQCE